MKRCGAEFFDTFWLVLGGCGSAVLAAACWVRRFIASSATNPTDRNAAMIRLPAA